MSSPPDPVVTAVTPSLFSTIGRIAHVIGNEHFPSGDRAALKRFAPGQAPPLAYFRFWARWMQQDAPPGPTTQPWALVLFGLALMGGQGHVPKRRLGVTLAEQGYSEFRLERLLAAEDAATRHQLFARTVRFLAAKGTAIDWAEAAAWLLAASAKREELSHRMARDYYRTQYHITQPSSSKE